MRRKKKTRQIYQFPEDLKKAYESSPLSFVYYQIQDNKAIPVLASGGFCRETQKTAEEVLTWLEAGMFERMHPDDVGVIRKVSEEFMQKKGPYDAVFRTRIKGHYEFIHGFGQWQTMPDGTELVVIGYVNVTETKEDMTAIIESYNINREDRFYTDYLTGLPNINYLHEFGEEKASRIRSEGITPHVIYVDIYSMQSYNSQYGVAEGNELLKLVAKTLKEQFPNALVTRGADDHFILITRIDEKEELIHRMERANHLIRKNAKGNTSGIRSGVCPVSEDRSFENALDYAKRALKRIENNLNREVAFFSHTADAQYWKAQYVLEHFDAALKEGWIKVYYQGLFRIKSEKEAAMEALARWVDPVRGMISPMEFIPVLQKYHQLYKLDLYMFEQVCREIKIRHENGLPLIPVSINFARQDFDHVDVVSEMNAIYEKYSVEKYVEKSSFIVEITEQDVALGEERFRDQLKRIRENGYRIWLDDFGSGYSSFNMFHQFQFDLLKYDMELLRHLDDNGGINRILLKDLVNIARELGIHTLAEGLENEEQLGFIRKIGCELAQGFYFNKPESLESVLQRLRQGDRAKECETKQEREELNRKWFDEKE